MEDDPKTTPRGTTTPVETNRVVASSSMGSRTTLWLVLVAVLAITVLFVVASGDDAPDTLPADAGAPVEGVDAPVAGSIEGNAGPVIDDATPVDEPATE